MSLPGTINANKDLVVSYQPLLLVQFVFNNGDTYFLSTHPLNGSEGGSSYSGADYYARISQQDIAAIQARSQLGIDRVGSVTLHIADPDRFVLNNYEKIYGFKGALVNLVLILHEPGTTNFSTDQAQKYTGVCSKPEINDTHVIVQSTATSPLQAFKMPSALFGPRCQHFFPNTLDAQDDAVRNRSSKYARCGYSQGLVSITPCYEDGSDGRRGNVDPATGTWAKWCDYSIGRCKDLGMFDTDTLGRITRRFSGIQWAPSQTVVRGKEFTSGNTVDAYQISNVSKLYGKPIPLVWGQCAAKFVPANKIGDPNSTRYEVPICFGEIDTSYLISSPGYVKVNGHTVPYNNGSDGLYTYYIGSSGTRTGNRTQLAGYKDSSGNPLSDPYGSMAYLIIVVYKQLATADSDPDIEVCFFGRKVPVFSSTSSYTMQTTSNSVWNLLDILSMGNSPYNRLNIQSFINWAPFCDVQISAPSAYGFTSTYPRYEMSLARTDRQQNAGALIAQALQSFDAQLVRDANGAYSIFIRSTLAVQQPSPVAGSNYNTAISSLTPTTATTTDGTAAPGYVAYKFFGDNILSIRELPRQNADTPNVINVEFYNKENNYVKDSDRVVDVDDVSRAGGYGSNSEVAATDFNPDGFTTYQQCTRVSSRYLLESLRGNETGDTRGTRVFEIVSHVGASHLTVGDIVLVDDEILNYSSLVNPLVVWGGAGIPGFLARVLKTQPAANYETVTVTVAWHEDFWYLDSITQYKPPVASDPRRFLPKRLPYPPALHDAAYNPSNFINFHGVGTSYRYHFPLDVPRLYLSQTTMADGSASTQALLGGTPVANRVSPDSLPPIVGTQATISPTGGSITAGNYVAYAFGIDANGLYTGPSFPVFFNCVSGTTNSAVLTNVYMQAGTVSLEVYAGPSDQGLALVSGTYDSTLKTYTITTIDDLSVSGNGAPDQLLDHYSMNAKRLIYPGAYWGKVTGRTHTVGSGIFTYTFSGVSWTTNQWNNYLVSHIARADLTKEIPNMIIKITSSTATKITVHYIDEATGNAAVDIGDWLLIRAFSTTFSANTIGNTYLTPTNATPGMKVRIRFGTGFGQVRTILSISGTTITVDTPWDTVPDANSVFHIEESGWPWSGITSSVSVGNPASYTTIPTLGACGLDNQPNTCYIIQLRTTDASGNSSLEAYSQYRDLYVEGATGTTGALTEATFTSTATLSTPVDQVWLDCTSGSFTLTLGFSLSVLTSPITFSRKDADPALSSYGNVGTIAFASGDTWNGAGTAALDNVTYSSMTFNKT